MSQIEETDPMPTAQHPQTDPADPSSRPASSVRRNPLRVTRTCNKLRAVNWLTEEVT